MYNYSIMPLSVEHADAICEDIREQYRKGVSNCALAVMTLVPEGNPVIDKAGMMAQTFDVIRDKLAETGDEWGILVQASIGHGYPLDSMFPFQRYVNLNDGEEQNTVCPYDEGFRAHFKSVMRTLASHRPKVIMVDDDFRLINRPGQGCACPLHMAEFNRRAGTNMTREELYAHTRGTSEEDRRYTQIFIDTQGDSLIGAAKAMREGIDSVNPALPGVFCGCGPAVEFAREIAEVLAGKGNPVIVRLNHGIYTTPGARNLTNRMYYAAVEKAVLGDVDAVLAETDTCPQNRYSTGAQTVHAHFAGSIMEGVNGAKHWITRLHAFEPSSGRAYRKKLGDSFGFYSALSELVPKLKWLGCRTPLSSVPGYGYASSPRIDQTDGWPCCVLERLGLPMYFSKEAGGAVFMSGPMDSLFTDEEILDMLRGPMFIASDTAMKLIERGFGQYLGVDVKPWTGERASGEIIFANGNECGAQKNVCQLIPLSDDVRAESQVYHLRNGRVREPLFPGVTVYRNSLGGMIAVFSGTPKTMFSYTEAFSMLNESRKLQLVRLLSEAGCLPVYYPEDAEVYLRAAACPDGSLLTAVFNLGFDPLDEIPLVTEKDVTAVDYLTDAGERGRASFRKENGRVIVEMPALTLNPVVLFLN